MGDGAHVREHGEGISHSSAAHSASEQPEKWFQRLFVEKARDYPLRPYAQEQWDVMFVIQGVAEFFFVDERAGLERRVMRLFIEGDDHRGANNAGVVIPPGVAHAMRAEGSADVIIVCTARA